MIENVDFSSLNYVPKPNEFDYMYILKKKIDEIIDHLNATHGADQCHVSLAPPTAWGSGPGGWSYNPETCVWEQKNESKA